MGERKINFAPLQGDISGCYYPYESFYIIAAKEMFDEDRLLVEKQQKLNDLIEELDAEYLLEFCEDKGEIRFLFYSGKGQIRALEFMDFLIPEFGLAKGNATLSFGRIPASIIKVRMQENDMQDVLSWLCKKVESYYLDTDWIDAAIYGLENEEEDKLLPLYVKKRVAWAYVNSVEIAGEGEHIIFRSLENESGLQIEAGFNRYIMIGYRGEVYDMTKEKFEATYEPTEEPLDVFKNMMEYIPEIQLASNGAYCSLDGVAHLCYPKPGKGIYAKELKRRTKVFYDGGRGYHIGKEGDYMAIRPDDMTDIYIIRRDIFRRTYEVKANE